MTNIISFVIWNIIAPGFGLKNKGHQGCHFVNYKGLFFRLALPQLQPRRGIKCNFAVIKGLKGDVFII